MSPPAGAGEELEAFVARMGGETGRIVPVYVSPVARGEIPQTLADPPSYRFWVDERERPLTLGDSQPIGTEREYYQGIRWLALYRCPTSSPRHPSPNPA